jgi:hypothetical protein
VSIPLRPYRLVRVSLRSSAEARSFHRAMTAVLCLAPRATAVPPPRKFLAIVNPATVRAPGFVGYNAALPVLYHASGIETEVYECQGPGDAGRYVAGLAAAEDKITGLDAVLVFGGDGTVAEVVNALCNAETVGWVGGWFCFFRVFILLIFLRIVVKR